MNQTVRSSLLAMSALCAVLAGAISTQSRWLLISYSLAAAVIVLIQLRDRSNRFVFVATYAALPAIGLLLALLFQEGNTINRVGILILCPVAIAVACVAYRIFRVEASKE